MKHKTYTGNRIYRYIITGNDRTGGLTRESRTLPYRYYRKLGDPNVVYLRWADIDTKVLGSLLLIVVCLTRQNERHLVILKNPGQVT